MQNTIPFQVMYRDGICQVSEFNISCPVIRYGELRQHALAYGNAGKIYINGVVSTLAAQGECVYVVEQIAANKR